MSTGWQHFVTQPCTWFSHVRCHDCPSLLGSAPQAPMVTTLLTGSYAAPSLSLSPTCHGTNGRLVPLHLGRCAQGQAPENTVSHCERIGPGDRGRPCQGPTL